MIEISEIQYGTYGKCLRISNGSIEAVVSIDFGPRIVKAGFSDSINFMKNDPEFKMKSDLSSSDFTDKVFYNRGGHRFWISPEAFPRTYYPDNNPVSYSVCGNTVSFVQDKQELNEFELTLELTMSETDDTLKLNHIVKNACLWAKELSPWALTVVADGGVELIAQNTTNTGLLSNRMIAFWPYTKMADPRFTLGDRYIFIKQDPEVRYSFKIGLPQERAWAAYFLGVDMFVKKYNADLSKKYPDGGCTYETYTNANILEMETLGELKVVEPGASSSHEETWFFYRDVALPATEDEADLLAQKYELD